ARARARRRLPLAQGQRPHFLAGARKARDRKERSNQMRASPQRAPRSPATRFACRFSLRCSTSARYARLRGTAQRQALLCRYGTEGRLEPERTARNHIQRTQKRTYKGRTAALLPYGGPILGWITQAFQACRWWGLA